MKKRALSVLLTICMMLTLLPTFKLAVKADFSPSGTFKSGAKWSLGGLTTVDGQDYYSTLTISGNGAMDDYNDGTGTSVQAPWYEYKSYITTLTIGEGITHIGKDSFRGFVKISSLIISSTVTSIGAEAFYGCYGITGSLTLPEKLETIDKYAFRGCSGITGNLVLPNNVVAIGDYAFADCSGLNGNLTLGGGLETIGAGAFEGCTKLTGSLNMPAALTSIGESAFNNDKDFTGSLVLDSKIQTIGKQAFQNCLGLTGEITIPAGTTVIGAGAFNDCIGITALRVATGSKDFSENDGVLLNKAQTVLIQCPAGKATTNGYSMPTTVTAIGDYAFSGCRKLSGALTLTSGLLTVGEGAFESCTGLTGVLTIPDGVTTVSSAAFSNCTGLTGVSVPASVISIGRGSFENCTAVTAFAVDADNANYTSADGVLFDKIITTLMQYPAASALTTYTVPDTVTVIDGGAFHGAVNLTGVTMQSGLKTIGEAAFFNCRNVTYLVIPASVTEIGNYEFTQGAALSTIYYEKGQTEWAAINIGAYNNEVLNNATKVWDTTAPKQAQAKFSAWPSTNPPYVVGGTYTLKTYGGSGNGAITWHVTAGDATLSATSGETVTVKINSDKNLNVQVTATKAGDATYQDISDTVYLSIYRDSNVGIVSYAGGTIYTTTSLDDVSKGLTRTGDNLTQGTLTLDAGQVLNAGTHDYNWTFTPKYPAIYKTETGTVSLTVETDPNEGIKQASFSSNNAVTATITCRTGGLTALCAVYGSGGQMLGLYTVALKSGANEVDFSVGETNASCAVLFVLDDSDSPQYASMQMSKT